MIFHCRLYMLSLLFFNFHCTYCVSKLRGKFIVSSLWAPLIGKPNIANVG
jgi:hypothetical protein